MRRSTVMAVMAAAAVTAAAIYAAQATLTSDEPMTGTATVWDGDTIRVNGHRIRLFGIDAFERKQTCRRSNADPYPCGAEATEYLRQLVKDQTVICHETPKSRDRYGRTVASCFIESHSRWYKQRRTTDLAEEMVRAGYAVDDSRYSKGQYAEAEVRAKQNGFGAWSGTFEPPSEWRKKK